MYSFFYQTQIQNLKWTVLNENQAVVLTQLTGSPSSVLVELLEVCFRPMPAFLWGTKQKKWLMLKDVNQALLRTLQICSFSLLIFSFRKFSFHLIDWWFRFPRLTKKSPSVTFFGTNGARMWTRVTISQQIISVIPVSCTRASLGVSQAHSVNKLSFKLSFPDFLSDGSRTKVLAQ